VPLQPSPAVPEFQIDSAIVLDALRIIEIHQHVLRGLEDELKAAAQVG
jgi:hypothetical protein